MRCIKGENALKEIYKDTMSAISYYYHYSAWNYLKEELLILQAIKKQQKQQIQIINAFIDNINLMLNYIECHDIESINFHKKNIKELMQKLFNIKGD